MDCNCVIKFNGSTILLNSTSTSFSCIQTSYNLGELDIRNVKLQTITDNINIVYSNQSKLILIADITSSYKVNFVASNTTITGNGLTNTGNAPINYNIASSSFLGSRGTWATLSNSANVEDCCASPDWLDSTSDNYWENYTTGIIKTKQGQNILVGGEVMLSETARIRQSTTELQISTDDNSIPVNIGSELKPNPFNVYGDVNIGTSDHPVVLTINGYPLSSGSLFCHYITYDRVNVDESDYCRFRCMIMSNNPSSIKNGTLSKLFDLVNPATNITHIPITGEANGPDYGNIAVPLISLLFETNQEVLQAEVEFFKIGNIQLVDENLYSNYRIGDEVIQVY
jgi:hypothetical protein